MNKLFSVVSDYSKEKKTYIVGTGRFALLQFTTMLQESMYVDAFCTFDIDNVGMEIMGKPVLDIKCFMNDTESNFLIAEEDYEVCEKKLNALGISNTWVDIRMYSLINDCVWTFM